MDLINKWDLTLKVSLLIIPCQINALSGYRTEAIFALAFSVDKEDIRKAGNFINCSIQLCKTYASVQIMFSLSYLDN